MSTPAIIFDLGKVLVDFDYSIAAKKIAARSHQSPTDLHAFLGSSPLLVQYESGQISREQFYDLIRQSIGFQGDLTEFGAYFAQIFAEISDMTALHAELRRLQYPTFIFSNTNDLAIEHIRRDFPFFANFDGYIFSYEIGGMKPHSKIYERMEAMTGKSGADMIYIDDRLENIEAGAARGWHAILHETPAKTRAALVKLGILTQ